MRNEPIRWETVSRLHILNPSSEWEVRHAHQQYPVTNNEIPASVCGILQYLVVF